MTEQQKQAILDTKIGCIEWTMSDVVDVFQRQYDRQPTDEELQQLLSMSWHMIEENCCSTGRETISDLLIQFDLKNH